MAETLTPGTITTLGQLRPGDVGEWPDTGERFVVTAYCVGRGDEPARYLGRGRIEPARIVMEGEPDRVAELEAQVRTLREALEEARLFIEAYEVRDAYIVGDHVRHALAATAPSANSINS